jgi:hypothetical protein
MGNSQINNINYEDMLFAINNNLYLIINTLPLDEQSCLIFNTIPAAKEEQIINKYIYENKSINIIIYGKNCNDYTIHKKYQQLYSLGINNVYIYLGGLFEWLMLQDIYGEDMFKTTSKEQDLLKYKPNSGLHNV